MVETLAPHFQSGERAPPPILFDKTMGAVLLAGVSYLSVTRTDFSASPISPVVSDTANPEKKTVTFSRPGGHKSDALK